METVITLITPEMIGHTPDGDVNLRSYIAEYIDYDLTPNCLLLWFQSRNRSPNGIITLSVRPPYLGLGRFHGTGLLCSSTFQALRSIALSSGCTRVVCRATGRVCVLLRKKGFLNRTDIAPDEWELKLGE